MSSAIDTSGQPSVSKAAPTGRRRRSRHIALLVAVCAVGCASSSPISAGPTPPKLGSRIEQQEPCSLAYDGQRPSGFTLFAVSHDCTTVDSTRVQFQILDSKSGDVNASGVKNLPKTLWEGKVADLAVQFDHPLPNLKVDDVIAGVISADCKNCKDPKECSDYASGPFLCRVVLQDHR